MGNAQVKDQADGQEAFADELAEGSTLMHGQYTIERFLNAGGFGITYAAKDSLDRRVVIKECFPGAFCRRSRVLVAARSRAHQNELASIVRLFVQEARSLAKLDHPNIVGVHQVFEENNTAYMALDFVEGQDLLEVIESDDKTIAPEVVEKVLRKVLDAVGFIHGLGILHRDISPDNILLDSDNNPVLIDFGAAREQATKQSRVLSALRVVKDGYSPQEFYIAGSEQGNYSDLYALGASFYHLLTDDLPPNSQARLSAVASGEPDPYQPLVGRITGYSKNFLMALDQSLAILPKDRIGSAEDWLGMMDGKMPTPVQVVSIDTAKAKGAEQAQPKSKKGLYLATAAAIGILAVAVATQTDVLGSQDAATVAPTVVAEAPTPVEAAPVAEQTAAIDAPVVDADPVSEPVIASATPEPEPTPVVIEPVEAPAVVAEVEAPAVIPQDVPVFEEFAAAPEPEVIAPVETPAVEDTVVATLQAPAELQNEEPIFAQDRAPLAERLAALAPVAPTTLIQDEAPLVAQNHAALADRLAEIQTPVVAQTDVVTPGDVAEGAQTAAVTVPSLETPALTGTAPAQPNAPETFDVAEVDTTPPVATPVPQQAPVLQPNDVQVAGIETKRRIQLPYDGFFAAQEGETRIYAVNGVKVADRAAFDAVVAETLENYSGGEVELQVRIGLRANAAEDQIWKLPVVYRTSLANGLVFDAAKAEDGWVTKVADVPNDLSLELQTGDQIFGYLGTNELLAEPTSMSEILMREVVQGTTVFHFAVKRGATTWAAAFPFETSADSSTN